MKLKEELGQVFTKEKEVKKMISLIQNKGTILEPSAGNGAFYNLLPKDRTVAIEIDSDVALKGMEVKNFFDENKKYDTIIGNPPYLSFNEINKETKEPLNI